MTWVLGIGGYSHDASAALLHEGQLVAAAQEERFSRIKHQGSFPTKAIRYCLDVAGIAPGDVAAVTFYTRKSNWDRLLWQVATASLLNPGYTLAHRRGFINSVGFRIWMSLKFRAELARFFEESGFSKRRFYDYDHHACHAASAYFCSPFTRAIVLCIDSVGDGKTTTAWVGEGNTLRELGLTVHYPHSIAHVYNRITKYLGFLSTGDEYKVMGLAAYGRPTYLDQLRNLVVVYPEGSFELNMNYFTYQYGYSLSERFYREFGPPRETGEPITQRYADMAASVQKLFEETVLHICRLLKQQTGIANLCLAGGAALNARCNGSLVMSGEFERVFVPSGASDLGTSIGAALYHWHQVLGRPRTFVAKTDDWGPAFEDEEIRVELDRAALPYRRVDDPAAAAAELIARGRIVGWFQGRMEFGPRALGHRSILADARDEAVKDRVNKTIKFREEFRPFAPSVLREHVADYFPLDVDCPFMTFTLDVRPEKRSRIPGIVHVDGSGRLQTVAWEDQPLYYRLIRRLSELTGEAIVLNTSFNLAGEPIVCSPFDAIRTFFTCGMDALVIGNYVMQKTTRDHQGER